MQGWIALTLALLTTAAHAGQQAGTIDYLRVRASDGLIFFALTGEAKTGAPACAKFNYWMLRDETSKTADQQYVMLLAAQMAGKTVNVTGLNSCNRWPDGEDVNEVRVLN